MNYVRLRHAAHLLGGEKRVTEVAFACGFSSVQYFNKIFKKYNGCTPSRYRRLSP